MREVNVINFNKLSMRVVISRVPNKRIVKECMTHVYREEKQKSKIYLNYPKEQKEKWA